MSWRILAAALLLLSVVACGPEPITPTPTVAPSAIQVSFPTRLGKGTVTGVAWSPDASVLAVSSASGIYLVDAQTWEQLRHLGVEIWATQMAFSPDGVLLAALSAEGIRLWRTQTGDIERVLGGFGSNVARIVFSPARVQDEFVLAAGNDSGLIRLWQVQSGRTMLSLQASGAITALAFSPDGSLFVAGTEAGEITVWLAIDGTQIVGIGGHTTAIAGLFFLPGGRLGSISLDGQIRLWDMGHCAESAALCGQPLGAIGKGEGTRVLSAAAFAADDRPLLALGMPDGRIELWHDPEDACSDGALCWLLAGSAQLDQTAAMGLVFSPDASTLVSVHQGDVVQLWQITGCIAQAGCDVLPANRLEGYTLPVESIALTSGGTRLVSGHSDGKVRVWQTAGSPEQWELVTGWPAHTGATLDVALSPDEQVLASIGDDNTIRLWRLADRTLLWTVKGHAWPMTSVAFSADGSLVATASCDKTVKLWRRENGALLGVLAHPDCVRSMDWSADGQVLVTGAEDGAVRIWQVPGGEIIHTLEGHEGAVWSVALSADQQHIVSGGEDRTVRIWSVAQAASEQVLKGHKDAVTSVRFSPDGAFVISGGTDRTVRMWQVNGAMLLYTLNHNGVVNALDVSEDGTLLASAAADGTVYLWQAVNPQQ